LLKPLVDQLPAPNTPDEAAVIELLKKLTM
jgi:hypothetical protein